MPLVIELSSYSPDPTPRIPVPTRITMTDTTSISSVEVSKPEHSGMGRFKVTEYMITAKYGNGAESIVRRPFEDFEWLGLCLMEERAGTITPALTCTQVPNKQVLFEEEFVTQRMAAMDRFLKRVVRHPSLVDAPSLLPFLSANPADWKIAKRKAQLSRSESSDSASMDISVNDDASGFDHTGNDPNTFVIDAQAPITQPKGRRPLRNWWAGKKEQWALKNPNLILEETPSEAKRFQDLQEYGKCVSRIKHNT